MSQQQPPQPVLQLLKPSLNYRLANSLIRKMWMKFLERLLILNKSFHMSEAYLVTRQTDKLLENGRILQLVNISI